MLKRFSFILLLLFFIQVTNAQTHYRQGYIVQNDGDTLTGEIGYFSINKHYYRSCKFKSDGEVTEYLPNEILSYGYDDRSFISGIAENNFVEVLVSGDLSLYEFQDYFFIEKGDELRKLESQERDIAEPYENVYADKVSRVNSQKWRGTVAYLVNDCLKDRDQTIARLKHNEKSLTEVVRKYNECVSGSSKVSKLDRPWAQINIGAGFGFAASQIKFDGDGSNDEFFAGKYESDDPAFGLALAFSLPRLSDNLFLISDIYLQSPNFYSGKEIETVNFSGETSFEEVIIDLNSLSIPLHLKYLAPLSRNIGVHFLLGLNYDFHLSTNTQRRTNGMDAGSAFAAKNSQFGFSPGVGFTANIGKIQTALNIKHFSMSELNIAEDFELKSNRLTVDLVIYFYSKKFFK